eukprot:Skav206843  [mRNA]  locus=scaffold637:297454:319565:- [translate_table: standard]
MNVDVAQFRFASEDFRCFLTSEPPGVMQGKLWDLIPEPILQRCIKVADEAPSDLKSNLRRAYSKFSQDGHSRPDWTHRSKKYPFNDGDLTICQDLSVDATKLEYSHYVKYIEERFPLEVPQINDLLLVAQEITGGGGGGGSADISASTPLITSYLTALPTNLDMIDIRGRSTVEGRLKEEDYTPFIIVSLQEAQPGAWGAQADRVNALLDQIRSSLLELELGISGALNVTEKMEAAHWGVNVHGLFLEGAGWEDGKGEDEALRGPRISHGGASATGWLPVRVAPSPTFRESIGRLKTVGNHHNSWKEVALTTNYFP